MRPISCNPAAAPSEAGRTRVADSHAQGAAEAEELVVADVDLASLRSARASERSQLLLTQPAAPEVCELARSASFRRQNAFQRAGATIL